MFCIHQANTISRNLANRLVTSIVTVNNNNNNKPDSLRKSAQY